MTHQDLQHRSQHRPRWLLPGSTERPRQHPPGALFLSDFSTPPPESLEDRLARSGTVSIFIEGWLSPCLPSPLSAVRAGGGSLSPAMPEDVGFQPALPPLLVPSLLPGEAACSLTARALATDPGPDSQL